MEELSKQLTQQINYYIEKEEIDKIFQIDHEEDTYHSIVERIQLCYQMDQDSILSAFHILHSLENLKQLIETNIKLKIEKDVEMIQIAKQTEEQIKKEILTSIKENEEERKEQVEIGYIQKKSEWERKERTLSEQKRSIDHTIELENMIERKLEEKIRMVMNDYENKHNEMKERIERVEMK